MIWEWANDPEARSMSFSSQSISWENHVAWFTSKRRDPAALLYVVTDDNKRPVGQVRFELNDERAVLSISIKPGLRGQGLGSTTLLAATEELFQFSNATAIDAYVKPENHGSQRLFDVAGFRRQGIAEIEGQSAIHFALTRNGAA